MLRVNDHCTLLKPDPNKLVLVFQLPTYLVIWSQLYRLLATERTKTGRVFIQSAVPTDRNHTLQMIYKSTPHLVLIFSLSFILLLLQKDPSHVAIRALPKWVFGYIVPFCVIGQCQDCD